MQNLFEIRAQGERSELIIYGRIGEDIFSEESNDAKTIVKKLAAISGPLDVRINSRGGSVADGIAIYNAIKRHDGKVTVYIDGEAHSIASLIAMSGTEILAASNAMIMVHAPWVESAGNANKFRAVADLLDKYAETMVGVYAERVGTEKARSWLTDGENHFFTASEAVNEGLADAVEDAVDAGKIAASWQENNRITRLSVAASSRVQPSEETNMSEVIQGAGDAPSDDFVTNHSKTVDAAKAAGAKAEAKRRETIESVFAAFNSGDELDPVTAAYRKCLGDTDCDELQARAILLDVLAKRSADPIVAREQYGHQPEYTAPPQASRHLGGATVIAEHSDKLSSGIELALSVKAGLEKDDAKLREAKASGLMGLSLLEMGRDVMRASGADLGGVSDKMGLAYKILASHTTSDFTNVLANIATKAAMVGYNEAPETWQQWCKVGNLTDFKQSKRVTTTAFPDLDKIPESGEYKFATLSDVGEPIQLATYGKKFRISRQALINDDLNVFSDIPRKMGRAAARTPGNLAYAVLTANAALSQDSTALFHANHGNLVASGSGAAPSVSTLQDAFLAMAIQTDPDDNVTALNLEPQFLIVPRALRSTARVLIGSEKDPTYDAANPGTPINEFYNAVTVVSDARLDADSTTKWYMAASPSQADTIEIAFLNGNQAPVVDQMEMTSPDGRDFYVRLDCAAAALGYVGLYQNAGA